VYLRWQYRIHPRNKAQPSLVAVLLESRRVNGQPRQRLVAYVGSVTRADIHTLSGRTRFWAGADARLAGFTSEDRGRFVRALEDLVPRPTAEEWTTLREKNARAKALAREAARAERASTSQETTQITPSAPSFNPVIPPTRSGEAA
jgi:hypothetical protein